jgi:hypothetical protein
VYAKVEFRCERSQGASASRVSRFRKRFEATTARATKIRQPEPKGKQSDGLDERRGRTGTTEDGGDRADLLPAAGSLELGRPRRLRPA